MSIRPEDKPTMLVVEESDLISRVMASILGATFRTVTLASGNECLQRVLDIAPTTIFLDVKLTGMTGFEICRRLKQDEATRDIPVIFVSENASVEEKMSGYDAGGDDFLGVPFHPPELLAKARVSNEHHAHIHELEDQVHNLVAQADNASKAAFAAMRSNSDIGIINQFVRASFPAKDFYELSSLLFQAMNQWQLHCTVRFRACDQVLDISEADYVPPLEEELLSLLVDRGRIVQFGIRAVFNHPTVSVLIKNMPEDAESCGIIRDSLAMLMECLEAKVESLQREYRLTQQRDESLKTLNTIKDGFKEHEQMTMRIMDDLMKNMSLVYSMVNLSESEESHFENLLNDALQKLNELYANGTRIDSNFLTALSSLNQVQQGDQPSLQ